MIADEKEKEDAPDDTRQVILNLLLDGPKTAGQIADKLKIQKSAVRSHLETLRAERSIRSYFRAEKNIRVDRRRTRTVPKKI